MASAKNNDKPLGNIKRVQIEDEVNRDPGQYPLKSGKLVTFPDVFDMPIEEAEAFFDEMDKARYENKLTPIFKKWLSPEDYKALLAEYDTPRKLLPVFEAVMNYYTNVWGSAGEGNASEG